MPASKQITQQCHIANANCPISSSTPLTRYSSKNMEICLQAFHRPKCQMRQTVAVAIYNVLQGIVFNRHNSTKKIRWLTAVEGGIEGGYYNEVG
jgi:hypothetical protein